MDHARKMVLVPEEAVHKLKSTEESDVVQLDIGKRNTVQTRGTNLTRLDSEMNKILNSDSLNDHDKWNQYQQVLQRYLGFQRLNNSSTLKNSNQPAKVTDKNARGVDNSSIVLSVPSTFRNKTEILLQMLDSSHVKDRITWDKRGEVSVDGKVIPQSNIIDLINDVIRSRKNVQANGREIFSWFLRDIGTPVEVFSNAELYKLGNRLPVFNSSLVPKKRGKSSSTPNSSSSKSFLKSLSFQSSDDDSDDADNSLIDSTIVENLARKKKSKTPKKSQKGSGWFSLA